MKIAILGTRGIPNNYGGFEQFAEYLSAGLAARGHEVTVYSPHIHPYQQKTYKNVTVCHIYSPEEKVGAAANFIYDYLCLKDALKKDFDILYEAGYHSNAPSYHLMKQRTRPLLITNMDGLEWKRSKWNKFTRWLIKQLEKLAVKKSHYLISDNIGIQQYYRDTFNVESFMISYGANAVYEYSEALLKKYDLSPHSYYLLIARLEPENNIETILDGYVLSNSTLPFVVIGNYKSKYGNTLREKYTSAKGVQFAGSIYHKQELDNLRHFAKGYFHGHSVGGTNPSLLEAMASQAMIVAHSNIFNQSILDADAIYFKNAADVADSIAILDDMNVEKRNSFISANLFKIETKYAWDDIIDSHVNLFESLLNKER
ncbi:MAG: DUF1972 domain-containing protein [Cytophagaceae bacterium]|jgi:glycosyltransferase involved in cell wall biosynthesis|nr:DUF1972 domain-containing protein [Cytophagaceae bacterium]